MDNLRGRTWLAVLGLAIVFVWASPNFFNYPDKWWLPSKKINFGLDIQGGLHLVMGVDVKGVVSESTQRLVKVLESEINKDGVSGVAVSTPNSESGEIIITHTGRLAEINKLIDDRYPTMLQVLESNDTEVKVRYFDSYMAEYKDRVIQQAIETIRNRIDEFGVAEPSISKQGEERILIQLPGIADAEKAKALINTAAKLDFMLVVDEISPEQLQVMIAEAEKNGNYSLGTLKYSEYVARLNEDLKSKIPANTAIYFEKADNAASLEAGRIPYLLKSDTGLGGDSLDDAFVSFNQYGVPEVSLRFNAVGAGKFRDLTGQNVGKRMAVVLDKVVKTAPNIQTQIGDGQAVITLGSGRDREQTLNEAKMISTALRAGALPASLEQLEERTVGPTLGADALQKAVRASYIGAILIILFMLVRYKTSGVISSLVIGINVFSVLALLSSLGATLTLPGIAGIALTVGFAVDANVLINERIREELAKGSSYILSLKEGYARALSAILDGNITTAGTALVLLYFGTGPVRGFAVTLLIGIGTTLFANVFLSKVIFDNLVHRFGIKKLSV